MAYYMNSRYGSASRRRKSARASLARHIVRGHAACRSWLSAPPTRRLAGLPADRNQDNDQNGAIAQENPQPIARQQQQRADQHEYEKKREDQPTLLRNL